MHESLKVKINPTYLAPSADDNHRLKESLGHDLKKAHKSNKEGALSMRVCRRMGSHLHQISAGLQTKSIPLGRGVHERYAARRPNGKAPEDDAEA